MQGTQPSQRPRLSTGHDGTHICGGGEEGMMDGQDELPWGRMAPDQEPGPIVVHRHLHRIEVEGDL
jgi:hypothetical protein